MAYHYVAGKFLHCPALLLTAIGLIVVLNQEKCSGQAFWTESFGTTSGSCDQGTLANNFVTANGTWIVSDIGVQDSAANQWYISATEPGKPAGSCSVNGCENDPSQTDRTLHVGNVPTSPNAITLCPTGDCGAVYDPGGFQNVVATNRRAESPQINCTGQSNIVLNFNYFEQGDGTANQDNTYVEYWDGTSWINLTDPPRTSTSCGSGVGIWTARSIPLPPSADNNPSVKIGFRWVNNNGGVGISPSFAVDSIRLTGGLPPVAGFSVSDSVLCVGDCILFSDLSQNAPLAYSWSFIGGTPSTSNDPNPANICYTSPGTYSVQLVVVNASGTDTLVKSNYITVNPCLPPVADFSADSTSVCERSCVNFTDQSLNGATSWVWNFPGGLPATSTSPNPTGICYFTPGSYPVTLIVSNQYGSDTLTLPGYMNINSCPLPVAGFNTSTPDICSNTCISFFDLSTQSPTSWEWFFPGASPDTSSQQNPAGICYPQDGYYDVTLIVHNQYGQDTLTQYSLVHVESVPSATVSQDTSMYFGNSYQLLATGGISYSWSPATGLDTTAGPSPVATPDETTTYTVQITDGSGCTGTRQVTVTILHDNDYFIPNTFSPNKDGHNDYLFVRGNNLYGVRFSVYDRWGEKVFETTDPLTGWDGTYKGKELDPAVFVYVLTINYNDGKTLTKTGNITLVR